MNVLIILFIVLVILLCAIGGNRGGLSFVVLVFNTIVALSSIFLLSKGINAIIVMMVSTLLFALITIVYQNELNVKSLASLISTFAVVGVMIIVIYTICINAHLAGFNEIELHEDSNQYIGSAVNMNMFSILIAGMIFGELGAVIDTSISIASAMNEIHNNNKEFSRKKLFKSGMAIGKDILGTTVNTLFFVSIGESLMLILYYFHYGYTFARLMNSKSFMMEIATLLFSCIGCVLVIPITSLVFAILVKSAKTTMFMGTNIKTNR